MHTTSAAIDTLCEALYKNKYIDVIDRMRPDSTISINPAQDGFLDIFVEKSNNFVELLKEAIFKVRAQKDGNLELVRSSFYDIKIDLVGDLVMDLHEINTKKENSTVSFRCQILATDSPKSYIKSAVFECPRCNNEYEVKCDIDRKITAPTCTTTLCKSKPCNIRTDKMVTDDVQTIWMQEPMEDSRHSTPTIFLGKLVGNLVSTSYVGQRKLITGLFRSKIDLKKSEHQTFIDIMSVCDLDETKPILPNELEEKKLLEDVKKEGFIDDVIGSYAPNIFGFHDIKLSLLLQLVGGVKTKKRGDINLFLIGDPSMAKSELLKFSNKMVLKSIYTSGRGSSAAGLTIGIVKMADGRSIAQAGVLPMCDGGLACIDEFDKMSESDRSSMHEAMEQQTVSIAKAGISMTIPSRTSVLAAANPKYGMYDVDSTIKDNINVPVPLLTRFDMIWLIRDIVNQTSDGLKAGFILDSFDQDMERGEYLEEKNLMAYINFAKTFRPILTPDSKAALKKIYETMRRLSSSNEMPVSVRQLEALVRLSMAYAKLNFRNEVLPSDVEVVKSLFEKMYESFGESLSSGGTQTKIFTDRASSKEHDVIKVWDGCKTIEGKVKLKDFERALIAHGMDELKAKMLIVKWENNNIIKLNSDGTYTRI